MRDGIKIAPRAKSRTPIPHTVAYIRKSRDGWRAEVQKNGIRTSHVAATKREAQAWAIKKEAELEGLKASRGMTFGQAADKYVTTVSPSKGPKARVWEASRLTEMMHFFGESTHLSTIDSARIGEWRDWRLAGDERTKPVSGSTVLRQMNLLRSLFSTAVEEWKLLDANPCKGVRMPEHNPSRHQLWTWPLIRRVLRAKGSAKTLETVRAFHIALHTGMRLNEVLAAKVSGKVAVLERDKSSGKASAPVKVPLARKGAALFAKYPPFTITADEASPLFSRLTDDLLIEGLTFHDSRASALTWLSRRMDVMTLARISRHRNMRILMDTYYRESAESIAARI